MGRHRRIEVNWRRCLGCGTCELACAFSHGRDFRPEHRRIWLTASHPGGAMLAVTCRQCIEAPCVRSCPTGALTRDLETGAITVLQDTCAGCKACLVSCPFGLMGFDPTRRVAAKCDLCRGDPLCLKYCLAGALSLTSGEAPTSSMEGPEK